MAEEQKRTVDREARIEQWIAEHGGQVYRTALYYMKDSAAAEDISQETFLLAYRHMDEFRGKGSPAGWLMRIAANQAKDALRSVWHRKVTVSEDWEAQEAMIRGAMSPEDDLADGGELTAAMGRLDDKLRRPLLLHYYYGFRDREIAALEDLSPAAVRKRLERGREQLRKLLSEKGDVT